MNTVDTYSINYQLYLENVIYHQKQMNRYIEECICLENGNIAGLEFLNEGAIDSIKETIEKIIETVKKFFARLMESFSKTFKSDQDYLVKYKDIILQKQVTLEFTDYMEYDITKFTTGSAIPKFAYEEMHNNGSLQEEEKFIQKYFPDFSDKTKEFGDNVKYILQGKEPTPSKEGKNINMKDLYNFCYEYKKIKETLEAEQKILDNAKVDCFNIITKRSNEESKPDDKEKKEEEKKDPNEPQEVKMGSEKKETGGDSQDDTSTNNKDLKESSIIYSTVYDRYINEAFVHELTVAGKDSSSSSTKSASVSNAPSDRESVAKNMKTSTGRQDEDLSKSMTSTDTETLKKEIDVYFSVCGTMLSNKIAIAIDMYKDFMFVIRQHVRSIVGSDDAKSINKAVDTPTLFTTRIDDEVYNKLNAGEKKEYDDLYEAYRKEHARYWAKNSKGVQYFRTDTRDVMQWMKVTDVNKDREAADKAFESSETGGKLFNDMKAFYKKIGYTGATKFNQAKAPEGEEPPEEKEKK